VAERVKERKAEKPMGRLIFVVFTIVPLIEIACFILIGNAIGLWPTLLGVLITALIGSILIRMQGIALLREIRETIGQGRLPTRALGDAMMVGIAGALLLAPGYFTDLIGILLLIPPVRAVIYRFFASRLTIAAPRAYRQRDQGTVDLDEDSWRPR
jgi:UPF0716 protein FxsA